MTPCHAYQVAPNKIKRLANMECSDLITVITTKVNYQKPISRLCYRGFFVTIDTHFYYSVVSEYLHGIKNLFGGDIISCCVLKTL